MATLLAEDDQNVGVLPRAQPDVPIRAPRQWDRVVAHRGWLAIRDRALAGLARRPAMVVILGEAGAGKTVLLHELSRVLAASGIPNAVLSSVGSVAAWEEIDAKSVLLIDDADRLDDSALDRLSADERRLVVLTERPGFADRINDLPFATTLLELAPLGRREIAGFLTASLPEEDRGTPLFSEAAIDRLAARSAGVPRRLHDLAGTALFLARRERVPQATARHVDQAALVGDADLEAAILPAQPRPAEAIARPRPPAKVQARTRPAVATPRQAALVPLTLPPTPAPAAVAPARRGRRLGLWAAAAGLAVAAAIATVLRAPPSRVEPPFLPHVTIDHALPKKAMPEASPEPPARLAPLAPPSRVAPPTPPALFREPYSPPLPVRPAAIPAPMRAPDAVVTAEVATPPSTALIRVLIGFPPNAPRAAQAAATLAAELRSRGFWVAEPSATSTRTKPGVWFGFAEDREAALRIAAALPGHGAAPTPRPQPAERGEPPIPGTVQIMVSSEGDVL